MTPYVFNISACMPQLVMVYTNQVAPGRAQTNYNDPNSKFQIIDLWLIMPNGVMIVKPGFAKRYNCGGCFGH